MKNTDSIAVCVPTYNRYQDLEKLIKSFGLQNYKKSELLILDDLGSKKTEPLVTKYQKKDPRIKYHKNKKNLGFSENLMQCFHLTTCNYVVFMGDDDLFIDNDALSIFIQAFADEQIGVVKARQILFKGNKINQAYPIDINDKEIQVYKPGAETFEKLWFESLSISGLAFRNNDFIKKCVSKVATLYPQVELMGNVSLKYASAAINSYLVAVKSHSGQLNCMVYELNGVKTNMLDDWLDIYERIRAKDKNDVLGEFNSNKFLQKFTSFMSIFFPYTALTRGKLETANAALNTVRKYPLNLVTFKFIVSVMASLILPSSLLSVFTEKVKESRLAVMMSAEEIKNFNSILSKYYHD